MRSSFFYENPNAADIDMQFLEEGKNQQKFLPSVISTYQLFYLNFEVITCALNFEKRTFLSVTLDVP